MVKRRPAKTCNLKIQAKYLTLSTQEFSILSPSESLTDKMKKDVSVGDNCFRDYAKKS